MSTNHGFNKRQKELRRKEKLQEKEAKKAARKTGEGETSGSPEQEFGGDAGSAAPPGDEAPPAPGGNGEG